MLRLLKALLTFTAGLVLLAQHAIGVAAEAQFETPDNLIVSQGLQVVAALALTLATIWGLSRVALKKSWHRNFKQQQIKVLDSVALGSRERVLLIEVDNHQVLIGSTPGQLRALHSFEKAAGTNFEHALKQAESAQDAGEEGADVTSANISSSKQFKGRGY